MCLWQVFYLWIFLIVDIRSFSYEELLAAGFNDRAESRDSSVLDAIARPVSRASLHTRWFDRDPTELLNQTTANTI